MEKIIKQYSQWKEQALPDNLRAEIEDISDNQEQIYDRFCSELAFGTSGLRGKMGVGTNRINEIVIRRATMGVADYLLAKQKNSLIVISYDTRIGSKMFAESVAKALTMRGIDVYIFGEPTPVPVLSFTVKHLGASGGIMITASHNPKEYNGYKVYDHCGNQIDDLKARKVETYINKRSYFEEIHEPEVSGTVTVDKGEIKEAYLEALKSNILCWTEDRDEFNKSMENLSVVYTPLNGSGRDFVMGAFDYLGVGNVKRVSEQWEHDGNFVTCPSPNPENPKALQKALEHADDSTDVIIATDPDSDRMGVMARKNGRFERLTGDQVGILMLDYVCSCHKKGINGKNLKGQKVVFKSLVSSPFAADIAKHYGVEIKNVPTGFKNIAKEMENLKQQGREEDFLFGYEESLGYLYGNYTRDKDGILAAQMTCLMAAQLKQEGKSLFDKIEELHKQHGYITSGANSIEFSMEKDRKTMEQIMEDLFGSKLTTMAGESLIPDNSYRHLKMFRASVPSGHQIIIRPSGTELKIKIYAFAKGTSQEEADKNIEKIMADINEFAKEYK